MISFINSGVYRFPDTGGLGSSQLPPVDTREVSVREGFGLPVKGYRIAINSDVRDFDQSFLELLVVKLQGFAIDKHNNIDFGGSVYISENGECVIQGEFAPNRYAKFTEEDFKSLIGCIIEDLKSLSVGSVSGGIRDYSGFEDHSVESMVGIEPGYTGQAAASFNDAREIIVGALDNVSRCIPGIVFYSFMSDGNPVRSSEPVVVVAGSTNDPDVAFSRIALGLKQTSVHAVIGTLSGPIHQAYKVKGELTAREAATQPEKV